MNAHGQVVRAAALLQVFVLIAYFIPSSAFAITCGAGTDIGGGQCRVFLTSGTSWTVPGDWNNSSNTIEAIGAGGNGYGYILCNAGGGGGGAYALTTNTTLSGTVSYQVGTAGGTTGSGTSPTANTWFKDGSTLVAAGGATPSGLTSGGTGGTTANSVGTTLYQGGTGGSSQNNVGNGGGGGAGGTHAAGNNGNNAGGAGGQGDGTYGGAGGSAGNPGSSGTEWDATHGSGGGGGPSSGCSAAGQIGGQYGAGGGGGTSGSGGAGVSGVIVITYSPSSSYYTPSVVTLSAQSFTPTTATVYGQVSNPNAQGGATTVGFAYSTDSTLTTGVSTTTISGTFGYGAVFSSSLTGLSANQVYYYRAYATNAVTTGFGSILSFGTGTATPVRKVVIYSGTTIKIRSGSTIKIRQQ